MINDMSIDEMKNAVAMANVLPSLLDLISKMNVKIDELKHEITDLMKKYNDVVLTVQSYIDSNKEISSKANKLDEVSASIEELKKMINKVNASNNSSITKGEANKAKSNPTNKKDKLTRALEDIKKRNSGAKSIILTDKILKNDYHYESELALQIMDYYKQKNMYDAKTNRVIFKK